MIIINRSSSNPKAQQKRTRKFNYKPYAILNFQAHSLVREINGYKKNEILLILTRKTLNCHQCKSTLN